MTTGPLTAVLVGGALRDVRVAGHRALDAIYVAVRDPDWGTVPGTVTDYEVSTSDDGFTATFACRHATGFEWRGRVTGSGGRIRFTFDGHATAWFRANRVGFCLLHPIELAGQMVTARTVDGERSHPFPERVSPHQPFVDMIGLSHEAGPGAQIEIGLTGDLFEMEDHRNWTDAGFKTYCTPLRLPRPTTLQPGDRIQQTVTVRGVAGSSGTVEAPTELTVRVGDGVLGRLPAIGFGHAGPYPAAAASRLRSLRPDHLYTMLDATTDISQALAEAATAATALGTRLDLAVTGPTDADWGATAGVLARHRGAIRRIAVFDPATAVTEPGTAHALRTAGVTAPVGGGSIAAFAELNRMRLPAAELDFVTFGVSPQVHHSDDESILDTLLAQAHVVRDANLIAGGLPVVVQPVTFHRPGTAPDPRQGSALAAAWSLGSVAALVGAQTVTYFAATGAGGLFTDPDDVHPAWQVFAALAGRGGHPLTPVEVPSRELAALAFDDTVVVANLRPAAQTVRVVDHGSTSRVTIGPYGLAQVPRTAG